MGGTDYWYSGTDTMSPSYRPTYYVWQQAYDVQDPVRMISEEEKRIADGWDPDSNLI